MFIVEEEIKPNKWHEHPVQFKDVEAAEAYALSLYEANRNARVVDEKYRKGRGDVTK